jgi:hypothetical protein
MGMRSHRSHISALVVLAVVVGIAAGIGVALFALPVVLIAALLVSGRYVGEERILAFRARIALRRPRAPKLRWGLARPLAIRSLFARSPRTLRGPPRLTSIV